MRRLLEKLVDGTKALVRRSRQKLARDGLLGVLRRIPSFLSEQVIWAQRIATTHLNLSRTVGTNVYEMDWDVLVVLDTCRVDALEAVADEYDWLTEIGSIWSVGGSSPEWVAKTFSREYADEVEATTYLTTNPGSGKLLSGGPHTTVAGGSYYRYDLLERVPTLREPDFARIEHLFEYEPRGDDGPRGHVDGHTPPGYVTDRAISVGRNRGFDRLVLHYWQPHYPYVANAIEEDRPLEPYEGRIGEWGAYIHETGDRDAVWNAYLDELRYGLDSVERLLENVDAETVAITADHGEAFGEYAVTGPFGVMGHEIGSLHPKVRRVPWVTVTATDEETHTPTVETPSTRSSRSELDEQLEALGYKT